MWEGFKEVADNSVLCIYIVVLNNAFERVLQCLKVNVKSYCTSVNFVVSLGTVGFHYLLFPSLSRGLGRLIT